VPAVPDVVIDWQQFHIFLLQNGRMNETTAKDRLSYAKAYASVLKNLQTQQEIPLLPPNKRLHVMKAISSLAPLYRPTG
jgi:hypothetical protein